MEQTTKYYFVFYGCKIGQLNTAWKDPDSEFRCELSANDVGAARDLAWKALLASGAYNTFEHFVIASWGKLGSTDPMDHGNNGNDLRNMW